MTIYVIWRNGERGFLMLPGILTTWPVPSSMVENVFHFSTLGM